MTSAALILQGTFTAPAHWASALINGDQSGLTGDEADALETWLTWAGAEGWTFVDVSEPPYFTHNFGRYCLGASGGEVADYQAIKRDLRTAERD